MAAVAASSCVRPACAAFVPPAAHKSPAIAVSFACSSSVQLRDCTRLVRNGNRMTTLGLGVRGLRRGSVVRASVEDMEDNMDDEGVVRDMERYLNDLSVEYENVWDTKPVWCQPWTIVLTGVIGVSLSWLVIKSAIVTGIVTVLVAGWWYVFLYTYPLAYTAMIAERRQKQRNGTEDTYGLRTRK